MALGLTPAGLETRADWGHVSFSKSPGKSAGKISSVHRAAFALTVSGLRPHCALRPTDSPAVPARLGLREIKKQHRTSPIILY